MRRFFFVPLMIFVFALAAFAQSSTGRIVGTVNGPDGVIPNATITVTDNQTKKERTIQSSGDGAFTVPQLDAGLYTVTVASQGFKSLTVTDVKVDAGRENSLNPALEVGGVAETVTIVGGAEVVNSSNGELQNTVSPQQITELPLDGRNPLALIPLQAGTQKSSGSQGVTTINGQRTSFTNLTRDGINVNDNFIRSNATDFSPERASSDDTGEFTVTTQNAGADQGYGAAQVQLVTPRGESSFHGALYEYNRNSRFSANTFTNNSAGTDPATGKPFVPRSFLNRNQLGGKIGGPFQTPRFGEGGKAYNSGKGFFFFAYEKQYLRQFQTNTTTVLQPSARAGNFTFVDSKGVTRSANLFSLPTVGGSNAPTGISPIIQSRILNPLPTPNTPGGDLNTGFFSLNASSADDYNYYTSRVDYDINDRNSVRGVFNHKSENVQRPDISANFFTAVPPVIQPAVDKFLSLAYTYTPGGKFQSNEIIGGFNFPVANFDRFTDIPSAFLTTSLINTPEFTFLDQGRTQHNYNLQDNASFGFGNHTVRVGALAQIFRVKPFNDAGTVPTFTLGSSNNTPQLTAASFASILPAGTTISANDVGTANSLFSLLGGIVSSGVQTFNPTSQTSPFAPTSLRQFYAFENYAGYVNDQWKVKPRLTLNFGLRYEIYTGLRLTNGIAIEPIIPAGTDPRTALLDPNGGFQFIGGNAGRKNAFFKTDKNNFAPILSFAYSPEFKNRFLNSIAPGSGKTVIRGAFRISYVPDQFLTSARNANNGNVGLGSTAANALDANGSTQLNARVDSLPAIAGPPQFTLPRSFAFNNSAAVGGNFGTVFGVDPNLQTGRTQEYSIGFQRELGLKSAIEVRYVGSYSKNLLRGVDFNQVNIGSNGFLADFNRARSNFLNTGTAFCNPATTAGCQALQLLGNTATSPLRVGVTGGVSLATFNNSLNGGTPADLATSFLTTNADFNPNIGTGSQFPFLANQNTGVVDFLFNGASFYYNSAQVEFRRRFSQGFSFQANYTFSKNLTDAVGTAQALFDPFLDNAQPGLDYSRADFDQTHAFNFNTIYEFPFGKGKRFLNEGGVVDKVLGGFQISTILRFGSGRPVSLVDPRGTLNRAGRSSRQSANSSLSKKEIKNLFGKFTQDGVLYYINPSVLQITKNANGTTTSRATLGFGQPTFANQVFFNVNPGQTGSLERGFINGPKQFDMDLGLAKKIRFGERRLLELRGEAFNLTNRNNYLLPLQININATNFGQLIPSRSEQALGTDSPRRLQFAFRFEF